MTLSRSVLKPTTTILLVGLILWISALPFSRGCENVSPAGAADSICFTAQEADSILVMVDGLLLENDLLLIDLEECRSLARVESSLNQGWTWIPGWTTSPWLWFAAGNTAGVFLGK
jgi:hypothetical protein